MKVNITGDNEFQGRRIMPPPWMVCPYIRRSSVGWRTGFGGAYAEKFQTWLKMMTPKEKKVYREMFPERITWKGWWDGEDKTELLRYKKLLDLRMARRRQAQVHQGAAHQRMGRRKQAAFLLLLGP